MANSMTIPTVDLSPFFTVGDEDGKKKVRDIIFQACTEYGFFQVVNHGVPLDLMRQAMELSKTYFAYPAEEKLKSSPKPGAKVPSFFTGYFNSAEHSTEKKEKLMMLPPGSKFNVLPTNPPAYREVMEELFTYFAKTGQLVESILNDCLGLPPNCLIEFNNDRSSDMMMILRYHPATDTETRGVYEHQDGNSVTFVLQDEVGGLEVEKDGKWIPVIPSEGTLVVNVGEVIKVLTNDRFKSAVHRVERTKGRSRYSFTFFYDLKGDTWVEPLPHFTTEIGEAPKYRKFLYKEYLDLRVKNKFSIPAPDPADMIHVSHYAIPN